MACRLPNPAKYQNIGDSHRLLAIMVIGRALDDLTVAPHCADAHDWLGRHESVRFWTTMASIPAEMVYAEARERVSRQRCRPV